MILENNIIIVPKIASVMAPPAHRIPMAASHQRVAAVVKPLIFLPSLRITPAPKKPIPATTWLAILETSVDPTEKEKDTKRKAPIETKIVVLSPTTRLLYCLSFPIRKLNEKH